MTDKSKGVDAKERARLNRAVVKTIAASRNDVDLKQGDLATRLGWTRSQVANIEQGRRAVQVSDLILIARALGVEPEKLFQRILRW